MSSYRAMVFAPLPPPVGGVASLTELLSRALGDRPDLRFVQTVRPQRGRVRALARPLINIYRLVKGALGISRNGVVLLFASSGASFWEKVAWAALTMALGRSVAMVMVDGNFPRVFVQKSGGLRAIARWVVSRPRCVIGVLSPSWGEYYRSQFPAATLREVLTGVEGDFFLARKPREHRDPRRVQLLYVGWIVEEKGVLDLLNALQDLDESPTRPVLRLVGPAFGRERFWEEAVERRNLSGVVQFVGRVTDRATLLSEYERADVFVFPSHFEGFPVALVEAAAAGLACVGSDVGGIPDILDRGRAGLIVPARDVVALAGALRTLTNDEPLRAALADAAAHRARERYTVEDCVASYLRLMDLT